MQVNLRDKDPDIFISYSSANKNIADNIVSYLEKQGHRCWYAPRDILPGTRWVSAINTAINSSRIFLLIFTDKSNDSRQVANEVALAFNAGKIIVPFKCNEIPMNPELEYYLTRVHWFDATCYPYKEDILDDLGIYIDKLMKDGDPSSHTVSRVHKGSYTEKSFWSRPTALVAAITVAVLIIIPGTLYAGTLGKKHSAQQLSQAVSLYYGDADTKKDHAAAFEIFEKLAEKEIRMHIIIWAVSNWIKATSTWLKNISPDPWKKVILLQKLLWVPCPKIRKKPGLSEKKQFLRNVRKATIS